MNTAGSIEAMKIKSFLVFVIVKRLVKINQSLKKPQRKVNIILVACGIEEYNPLSLIDIRKTSFMYLGKSDKMT